MEASKIWSILGIEETKDEGLIKQAYRNQLVSVNPEDDSQGFMELRKAYEEAMRLAKLTEVSEEKISKNDVDLWVEEAEYIYKDMNKRRVIESWKKLCNEDVCKGLDTWHEAREKLLVFFMNNCYLPHEVWTLLDREFRIVEDRETLSKVFPMNFLIYITLQIKNEPFIDYNMFVTSEGEDIDTYIRSYYDVKHALDNNSLEELPELIKNAESYSSYHPYVDVEKLRYYIKSSELDKLKPLINKLESNCENIYIDYYVALGKWELLEYEEAARIWMSICEKQPQHYGARVGLLKYYIYSKEYEKANDDARELLDIYQQDDEIFELLKKVNEKLIIKYKTICDKEPDNIDIRIELCWCYYQNSYLEECLEALKMLPQEEKEKAICFKLHGYVYLKQEKYSQSLSFLLQWLELLPQTEDEDKKKRDTNIANYLIGLCYVNLKKYEDAVTYLKEAVEKEENEGRKLINMERLAYAYLQLEENENCIDLCNQIISISSGYYPAYLHRQEANFNMKNGQAVMDDYRKAVEIYPNYVKPYIFAAKVLFFYEQYEDSIEIIKKAKELKLSSFELDLFYAKDLRMLHRNEQDRRSALDMLLDLIARMKKDSKDNKDEFRDLGEVYYETAKVYALFGNFKYALGYIKEAIKQNKYNDRYKLTESYIYMDLGEYSKAITVLDDLSEKYTEDENIYYNLGECYEKRYTMKLAVTQYKKVLELNPNHLEANNKLMDYYQELYKKEMDTKYYEMAKPYAKQILEIEQSCYYYVHVGMLYMDGYELEEALKCYEKAAQCDPEDVWPHNNAAYALKILGRYDEAIEELKKAIALMEQGKSHLPHSNLADCYEITGRYGKALACYQELIRHFPNALWAYEEKAGIYKKLKEYDKAAETFMEMLHIEGAKKEEVYCKLMFLYEEAGNEKKAIEYSKLAIKENRLSITVWRDSSEFYQNIGKFKNAKRCIKQVLKLDTIDHKDYYEFCFDYASILYDIGKKRSASLWAKEGIKYLVRGYGSEDIYVGYKAFGPVRCQLMGMIYLILKDYGKSEEYFLRAIGSVRCKSCRAKGCYEGYYGLGRLYEAKGEYGKAIENYKKAMDLKADYTLCKRHLINCERNLR